MEINWCLQDWLGLPAGVKFDPTDQELIEHLEAKVEAKDTKSHPLIDEFIPTIEGEDGICYTHPEKLPGHHLLSSSLVGYDFQDQYYLSFLYNIYVREVIFIPNWST